MTKTQRIPKRETVTGRDGKEHPAQIERQPRGKTEKSSAEESASGAGGGGGFAKGNSGSGATGGSTMELERDARAMIRKGEMNPFELRSLMTANAHDYAETVIALLDTMKRDDPKRGEGLLRIKRWIDKALAGDVDASPVVEADLAPATST